MDISTHLESTEDSWPAELTLVNECSPNEPACRIVPLSALVVLLIVTVTESCVMPETKALTPVGNPGL